MDEEGGFASSGLAGTASPQTRGSEKGREMGVDHMIQKGGRIQIKPTVNTLLGVSRSI